jgi:hypothetical protein
MNTRKLLRGLMKKELADKDITKMSGKIQKKLLGVMGEKPTLWNRFHLAMGDVKNFK